jgi:hypothetical protein
VEEEKVPNFVKKIVLKNVNFNDLERTNSPEMSVDNGTMY